MTLLHAEFLIYATGTDVSLIDIKTYLRHTVLAGKFLNLRIHLSIYPFATIFRCDINTLHPPVPLIVPVTPLACYHQTRYSCTTDLCDKIHTLRTIAHNCTHSTLDLTCIKHCPFRLHCHIYLKPRNGSGISHTACNNIKIILLHNTVKKSYHNPGATGKSRVSFGHSGRKNKGHGPWPALSQSISLTCSTDGAPNAKERPYSNNAPRALSYSHRPPPKGQLSPHSNNSRC